MIVDEEVVADLLIDCFKNGGKVLVCGNGGSAADAEHIVAELMKSFKKKRPIEMSMQERLYNNFATGNYIGLELEVGFPAISLNSQTSLMTAIANDMHFDMIFAQQTYVYGNEGDVLIALSTSGSSSNVNNAVITARVKDMKTIAITGNDGGFLANICNYTIKTNSDDVAEVQNETVQIYHKICEIVEDELINS